LRFADFLTRGRRPCLSWHATGAPAPPTSTRSPRPAPLSHSSSWLMTYDFGSSPESVKRWRLGGKAATRTAGATSRSDGTNYRGGESRLLAPLPPNWTGGSPASGPPVDGSPPRGGMVRSACCGQGEQHVDGWRAVFSRLLPVRGAIPTWPRPEWVRLPCIPGPTPACLAATGTCAGVIPTPVRVRRPPSYAPFASGPLRLVSPFVVPL